MTHQETEKKIREACPELGELSFGCVIKSKNVHELPPVCAPIVMKADDGGYVVSSNDYGVVGNYQEKDIEVLGHPIQLAHVLRTMNALLEATPMNKQAWGEIITGDRWDLKKDWSGQSEQTKRFVGELLGGKTGEV